MTTSTRAKYRDLLARLRHNENQFYIYPLKSNEIASPSIYFTAAIDFECRTGRDQPETKLVQKTALRYNLDEAYSACIT